MAGTYQASQNRTYIVLVLTNLVVKACQVVRALVVVEALASQANAQGVTSVPSPAWQYFSCPFCAQFIYQSYESNFELN